tara:strand:- start:340 stop:1797 length:1458 start_codon:yes stop_codon:yes gene_type:complete
MIPIEYSDKFTNYQNLVIIISNISDLNKINFPFLNEFDLKNVLFRSNLVKKKEFNLKFFNNNKSEVNIIFKLVDSNLKDMTILGSELESIFSFNENNKIGFIFSKKIILNKPDIISEIIFGFLIKLYKFDKYKLNKISIPTKIKINQVNKLVKNKINYNLNLLKAINLTKDLVSEPANVLNPVSYSQICKNLKVKGLKIKELNKTDIEKIGMRSLLAVSQGSDNEPRVVVMEWNLKKNTKPIVLAGKGVTFDTGGISLKPSSGMEEMITDMGGSAVVVGSMINAALNQSKKSIIGIIGLVENMPDAKAQRPGDIIKSLSGQTIEVLNTDAEGRLVLADIITYVQKKYNPSQIIDFATLTGAIMIALGTHKAGLFSNNKNLAEKLIDAGIKSNENLWQLPMGEEYNNEINSPRADMKNIGSSRYGGSIHAAEFIKRFIENKLPWAHIDIAGVSWTMKGGQNNITKLHRPGATAFGVRLIDKYLKGK